MGAKFISAPDCTGIEYMNGGRRCEVWTRPDGIGATKSVSGFTCLRYVPTPVPTSVPTSNPTTTVAAPSPVCDAFSAWPDVDGGVTCGSETCTALVLTQPYG